jgi:hypothetical protein
MPVPNKTSPRFGGAGTPFQEVPAGTVDGANAAFTLTHTPWAVANLVVWLDSVPVPQVVGATGYQLSGLTITFGTAPGKGQKPYAFYYY